MARRIRFALSLLLVSFAMTAADVTCDHNNPNTCH